MMRHKSFACLILTHGRPDNVITAHTLRNQGYTGEILYVIDDEDETAPKYRENFGSQVITFNKEFYLTQYDTMDNGGDYLLSVTTTHSIPRTFATFLISSAWCPMPRAKCGW